MKVDRDSAVSAAQVIERLLPEPASRRAFLTMLADTIDIAHSCGVRCWGITLNSNLVRLNAGGLEVVTLTAGNVYLVLDGAAVSDRERRDLGQHLRSSTDNYRSVSGEQVLCDLPPEMLVMVYPQLTDGHRRFIEQAAATKRVSTFRRAFSPGVLRYLANELGREIPWPGYADDPPSAENDSPVVLSDDDCAAFLAGLGDLDDIRKAPTAGRCNQFRIGWREAVNDGREYRDSTLKRLTWRNLGYRLGQQWGTRSAAEIDEVYERFAHYFRERHPTITTSANPGHWQADILAWVHRKRQVPDSLAEDLVTFFTRCFEHNRCPEHAWFGIPARAVSLVVGQLYLGALNLAGGSDDRGLWLLLDRSFDDLPGMDSRVVKSTRNDLVPLTWGRLTKLEHLPALNEHAALWASHAAASARIMGFPIASARSEAFHRRRHRRRLIEFWRGPNYASESPPLGELTPVSRELEAEGAFDPGSMADARRRIERAIVQRQGQARFREQLLANYGGRCPITGCDLSAALEAAHIIPYNGEQTNHPANGLPLRADIHTLFDLYLLSVKPESRRVVIAPTLRESCYAGLAEQVLAAPEKGPAPDQQALEKHYDEFVLRWYSN